MATLGVFPVFSNVFKVGVLGSTSTADDMASIADMETFGVSIDNGVEEWNPMEEGGWTKRLITAKSISITLTGKRHFGDEGNDYLADLAWKSGRDCNSKFEWVLPSGAKVEFDCVCNVTTFGGDSTAVDALEVEILSNGKPTFTEAPSS